MFGKEAGTMSQWQWQQEDCWMSTKLQAWAAARRTSGELSPANNCCCNAAAAITNSTFSLHSWLQQHSRATIQSGQRVYFCFQDYDFSCLWKGWVLVRKSVVILCGDKYLFNLNTVLSLLTFLYPFSKLRETASAMRLVVGVALLIISLVRSGPVESLNN